MIQRKDLFAVAYYKKAVFTGSDKGMCYRIERVENDDGEHFKATAWEGPYNYETTPDEKKTSHLEEFSEEGLFASAEWLNEQQKSVPSTGNFKATL